MGINIIEYITKNTKFRQIDIANKLGVSRAQISKWKAGEYIPSDREEELIEIAGLFSHNPEWAIWAKTEENAQDWMNYIIHMCERVDLHFNDILDEPELYIPMIIIRLVDLGVSFPEAPSIEDMTKDWEGDEDDEEYEVYNYTDFDNLISEFLENYSYLTEWCDYHFGNSNDDLYDQITDLSDYACDLSLRSIDKKLLIACGVNQHQLEQEMKGVIWAIKGRISSICNTMNELQIPITTDYFNYVNKLPAELDDELLWLKNAQGIEQFLPYGQQLLLQETRQTNQLLEKLFSDGR